MFYIWHTLLVTAFIGITYYLGYHYGVKKKVKIISQKKLWKVLKATPKQEVVEPHTNYMEHETPHEEWIKGYNKWKSRKIN